MIFSKETDCFQDIYIYIWSVFVFPENWTHDLDVAVLFNFEHASVQVCSMQQYACIHEQVWPLPWALHQPVRCGAGLKQCSVTHTHRGAGRGRRGMLYQNEAAWESVRICWGSWCVAASVPVRVWLYTAWTQRETRWGVWGEDDSMSRSRGDVSGRHVGLVVSGHTECCVFCYSKRDVICVFVNERLACLSALCVKSEIFDSMLHAGDCTCVFACVCVCAHVWQPSSKIIYSPLEVRA